MEEELILPGYTRVTEPLQVYSKYDMIDPEVLANAADRGTRVHKFCEMHAKGLWFVADDDCHNYVECFKKWFDDNVRDVIFTEKRFYNDELMITGQVDMSVILKNSIHPSIIDIKTTSCVSKSWSLQTAIYTYLSYPAEPFMNPLFDRRLALKLPKIGSKVNVIEYTDYENDLRLYLNCLELYRYMNPPKKSKEIDFVVA